MAKKLTAKQQRFIEEYLVDCNATQAAIRAGYSKKTAKVIGAENLTKPDIATAVADALEEQAKRTRITADDVLRGLTEEARDKVNNPGSTRVTAWSWIGRHFAMFTERRSEEFGGEPHQVTEVVFEHGEPSTNGKNGNGAGPA